MKNNESYMTILVLRTIFLKTSRKQSSILIKLERKFIVYVN